MFKTIILLSILLSPIIVYGQRAKDSLNIIVSKEYQSSSGVHAGNCHTRENQIFLKRIMAIKRISITHVPQDSGQLQCKHLYQYRCDSAGCYLEPLIR